MEDKKNSNHPAEENEIEVKSDLQKGAVPDESMSPENSEYDSADSYSDEHDKVRSRASDPDERCNSDTGGSLILEREDGDGQESVPSKKVDDDEDKKNPQYIPKRGTFYEHDDRSAEDIEAAQLAEAEKDKDVKKKIWCEKKEKWSHDRFNDNEQAPKSKDELVSIYGYDIRNEEGAPRARRRRRYGRGPNKYTRNWEDENAYNKPPPMINNKVKKQGRRKKEKELSSLDNNEPTSDPVDSVENTIISEAKPLIDMRSKNLPESNKVSSPPRSPPVEHITNMNSTAEVQIHRFDQRVHTGRVTKQKKEIKDSDYRGFTTKTWQQRNHKIDQQKMVPPSEQSKNDFIKSQYFSNINDNLQDMEKEMNKLSIDGVYKGGRHNYQRQCSVPPRLQAEQKGSKRYSSMRQRSLPESNTPPVPNFQPTSFYPTDYPQQTVPQAPQPLMHQAPQIMPAPTQVAQITQSLPPIPQQVPVTAAPLMQAQFSQAFQQPPPAFLPTGVAPPTFIQPPAPQIISYVQGQPTFPPNFQGYHQQQFNPVTPPTELYQPQGGITYYSTDHQVIQRPVPQKRPKAAIPIVAPPSHEMKDDICIESDSNIAFDSNFSESIELVQQ